MSSAVFWLLSCCLPFVIITQVISGGSEGFMADCPGSDLPIEISAQELDKLLFVVFKVQEGEVYRREYKYSEAAKLLTNDPMIDWTKKTMLYVHGYMDNTKFPDAFLVAAPYTSLGYNVLMLDTFHFTINFYTLATRYIRTVGAYAAKVLAALVEKGLDPKQLEIVGMSLGAQTASFIGKEFQTLTSINVSRITGLDPAGPCFRNLPPSSRLDSGDADFVDVIHTNANGLGGAKPWGHVDFYVNGGGNQVFFIPAIPCPLHCSHNRVLLLWTVAVVRPHAYIGIKCDSQKQAENLLCYDRSPMETNTMGLLTNKNLTGIFLLNTSNRYPYALGNKGLSKMFATKKLAA